MTPRRRNGRFDRINRAFLAGHDDYRAGLPFSACPYAHPDTSDAWRRGWQEAAKEALQPTTPPA